MAIVAPVLILVLLLAIDFGRAFYSWVILQNAARIGANFAGLNADGWKSNPDDPVITAEYQTDVQADIDRALCDAPASVPDPVFTDSPGDTSTAGQTPDTAYDVGDTVKVSLTCVFHPLTPVISAIVSSNVTLGASADFRIRAGDIAGLNNAPAIPPPSAATPTPIPTPIPTAGPTPTGTPSCAKPTANFASNPNPATGNAPLTVVFTDTSTAPASCPITSWSWTFGSVQFPGNPQAITGQGPQTVVFATPNKKYDVKLTVTNAAGSTTYTANNYVTTK